MGAAFGRRRKAFREYAAGLVLMIVFAGQIALNDDRFGGVIGLASSGS